jgi:hypothetical protein
MKKELSKTWNFRIGGFIGSLKLTKIFFPGSGDHTGSRRVGRVRSDHRGLDGKEEEKRLVSDLRSGDLQAQKMPLRVP